MAEPWECPACSVWLAPSVSMHRCDGDQGSAGATVTPIVPTGGGSGAGTATVTWTGDTIIASNSGWEAAAHSTGTLALLDRMLENAMPRRTGRRSLTKEQRAMIDPRIRSA